MSGPVPILLLSFKYFYFLRMPGRICDILTIARIVGAPAVPIRTQFFLMESKTSV